MTQLGQIKEWYINNIGVFNYVMTMLKVISAVLVFKFMLKFGSRAMVDRYELAKDLIVNGANEQMKRSKNNIFNADYVRKKLDSYGVTYRTKGKVTPIRYILSKLIAAIIGAALGFMLARSLVEVGGFVRIVTDMAGAIIAGVIGFNVQDLKMIEENKQDNDDMIDDIMNIYQCIILQGSSGDNITRLITEAFLIAKNKRLETALLELSGALNADTDMLVAIEVFEGKFKSEAVSNFAVCLKQMIEIGNYESQMTNASRHLEIMREINYKKQLNKSKALVGTFGLAVFSGIMAVFIYLVASGIFGSLVELDI